MASQGKPGRSNGDDGRSNPLYARGRPYSAKPKRSVTERNVTLLTDEEAADVLACTAKRVRKLYYEGELPAVYVGGLFRVDVADVHAYTERRKFNRRSDV